MTGSLDADDDDVIPTISGANERCEEDFGSDATPLRSSSIEPIIKAEDDCSESSEASVAEEVPGKEETPLTFAEMFDPETPVPGSEKAKTAKKTKKSKKMSKLGKGAASKPKKESIW
ncbi:hypothetical protein E4U22_000894 [Claviceps purpurea]|nr:hypothetical protein E4U22_000894 [Claviceps purpurea]